MLAFILPQTNLEDDGPSHYPYVACSPKESELASNLKAFELDGNLEEYVIPLKAVSDYPFASGLADEAHSSIVQS